MCSQGSAEPQGKFENLPEHSRDVIVAILTCLKKLKLGIFEIYFLNQLTSVIHFRMRLLLPTKFEKKFCKFWGQI